MNTHFQPSSVIPRTTLLIGGKDEVGRGALLSVVSPVTEEPVASFAGASPDQVDAAIAAARRAFDSGVWSDPQRRRDVLRRFADLMVAHREELMELLVQEVGSPVNLMPNHIDTPASFLRWFADQGTRDWTRHLGPNASNTAVSMVAYRPVGVVGAITAFNYPILIGATKIGAALSVGCTTVLLSSPQAPLAVLKLGEIVREAGFPDGVVNILAGGADVGRALTEHPGVDKITFTGSVNVGRQVMTQAAAGLRDVVLELGGKSAAILLPGADLSKIAFPLHARYARNAGQGCGSPTRILVEASRYDEFCSISREVYPRITVGDPRDPNTIVGPVITAAQRERIEAGVARSLASGGTLIAGGGRPDVPRGWFLNPALVGGLSNADELARNEIFGPVSVVLPYRDVDEAIAIANDSELGLKAYLFGQKDECLRLAPRLRVGTVQINGGSPLRPDAPMIGYKNSGNGAEWGEDGLREFLLPQHIDLALA